MEMTMVRWPALLVGAHPILVAGAWGAAPLLSGAWRVQSRSHGEGCKRAGAHTHPGPRREAGGKAGRFEGWSAAPVACVGTGTDDRC
eukprot:scaffold11884_cov106-Isochrysis_galbana.AAC.6